MISITSVLEELRRPSPDLGQVRKQIAGGLDAQTRQSFAHARANLPSLPASLRSREGFGQQHSSAWLDMFDHLAHWEERETRVALPRTERVLFAAWHFPEIPKLFGLCRQAHILLLVSQDAPWLVPLQSAGCTLNFRLREAQRRLTVEMGQGRMIGAMLDHIYPGTRNVKAPLFGKSVETPSALFALASSNRYLVSFIAPRATTIEVITSIEAAGRTEEELATWFNRHLEIEIQRAPERWLMWQSLTYRHIGER